MLVSLEGFALEYREWATPAQLAAHLAQLDPAAWRGPSPDARLTGVVFHHTYRPTVAQWVGGPHGSILSIARYYRDRYGWDRGPHLFLADRIYQMTPLNQWGIHAQAANRSMIGVEICGDYDHVFWPEPLRELAFGTLTALCAWLRLPPERVALRRGDDGEGLGEGNGALDGHRNYTNEKSCPGWAVNIQGVRAEIARRLAGQQPAPNRPRTGQYRLLLNDVWIRQSPAFFPDGRNRAYWEQPGSIRHYMTLKAGDIFVADAVVPSEEPRWRGAAYALHSADGVGFIPCHPALVAYEG